MSICTSIHIQEYSKDSENLQKLFETAFDGPSPALKTDATAVNANVRVEVYNSNNTYTNSKCSAMIDGGLKIGGLGLCP